MLDRRLVAGVYAVLGAIGAGLAVALGRDPLTMVGSSLLLPISVPARLAVTVALGLALAAASIGSARAFVARFSWARSLQSELEPVVRGSSDTDLLIVAIASGIAEELLFRGLLTQLIGIVVSSLLFGALHQVRGTARWAWAAWATVMGLCLAFLFAVTGSLLGPILAHVLTNAVNLRFVRDHGAPARPRTLASLLRS